MKRYILYFASILWITFYSCQVESPEPTSFQQLPSKIYARGILTEENLPEGSTALFNAAGSIQITNEVFQLTDGEWTTDNESIWDSDITDSTFLTILFPTFPDHIYSTETLYAENELEDVLIAQDTLLAKTDIQLEFSHLFSKLTVRLDEAMQDAMESISITTPKQVSSIHPATGTCTLIETSHTTQRSNNGTSDYHFLIPPDKDCTLTLTILTSENDYTYTLDAHTFQSGYEYICKVSKGDTRPGIRTADEFITFSQLINANPLSQQDLSQFGDTIDGKMTYRLLADIDFEGVDCTNLSYIRDSNSPFEDIFEGGGHTISNLTIAVHAGSAGLFGAIEATSIIRDLHLDHCSSPTIEKGASKGMGLLVGLCFGTLTNCSVTNGKVTLTASTPSGGLVGTINGGTVSDCHVSNTDISSEGNSGAIAGRMINGGSISNSYSSSNTLSIHYSAFCGGLCGQVKNGTITNCYVHKISSKITHFGRFIGKGENYSLHYCYYGYTEKEYPFVNESSGTNEVNSCKYFSSDYLSESTFTPVVDLLNQWVVGKDYATWIKDESGAFPAVFE